MYTTLFINLLVTPLSPNQWGFKSTTTALLSFIHKCQEALDNGGEVCSVKPLTQSHINHFCVNYSTFQVNPFLLKWIHNYLSATESSLLCWVVHNPIAIPYQLSLECPKGQFWYLSCSLYTSMEHLTLYYTAKLLCMLMTLYHIQSSRTPVTTHIYKGISLLLVSY